MELVVYITRITRVCVYIRVETNKTLLHFFFFCPEQFSPFPFKELPRLIFSPGLRKRLRTNLLFSIKTTLSSRVFIVYLPSRRTRRLRRKTFDFDGTSNRDVKEMYKKKSKKTREK